MTVLLFRQTLEPILNTQTHPFKRSVNGALYEEDTQQLFFFLRPDISHGAH